MQSLHLRTRTTYIKSLVCSPLLSGHLAFTCDHQREAIHVHCPCRPILSYGLVSYEDSLHIQRRIDGAYTRMLRYALNAHFDAATKQWDLHTEDLLGNTTFITARIARGRGALVGHCLRAHAAGTTRHPLCDTLLWDPPFRLRSGGQCNNLRKTILRQCRCDSSDALFSLAMQRRTWRQLCANIESTVCSERWHCILKQRSTKRIGRDPCSTGNHELD